MTSVEFVICKEVTFDLNRIGKNFKNELDDKFKHLNLISDRDHNENVKVHAPIFHFEEATLV